MTPALIVFSGLPGVGKTTVARVVAARLRAVFLRVDDIEHAIRGATAGRDPGAAGYAAAQAMAEANLRLDLPVVADCVNPVEESREAWRSVAARTCARHLDVEVVCSDRIEHERRVRERTADIAGHVLPSWQDVSRLRFQPWTTARLTLDTAILSPERAAGLVMGASVLH